MLECCKEIAETCSTVLLLFYYSRDYELIGMVCLASLGTLNPEQNGHMHRQKVIKLKELLSFAPADLLTLQIDPKSENCNNSLSSGMDVSTPRTFYCALESDPNLGVRVVSPSPRI